jgi:regulator of sirC expression with transglutaminase-like and TPR domain
MLCSISYVHPNIKYFLYIIFTGLNDEDTNILECCQKLIDAYPDDLNSNVSTELQQFHSYIRHKLSATKAAKARFSILNKVIVEDSVLFQK